MGMPILLSLAACFLAYSNGANDNFKGVATLFGSGTTNYKGALGWATFSTLAGSLGSIFLARSLLRTFSGQGLVPDAVAGSPDFLLPVAVGAGLTVLLATLTGFPISTTHSLTGALLGAGLMAVGLQVNFAVLGQKFFLPLLLSPLLALTLGAAVYALFRYLRIQLGITKEWCLCVGETERIIPIPQPAPVLRLSCIRAIEPALDSSENCVQRYSGSFVGIRCQRALDLAHYASAGLVSFARGLNDTPKIAALLLSIEALGIPHGILAVALGMAAGGLLNARRVAETIGKKITPLNCGQGFSANLATGILVVFAGHWGMPVSTTHVSVGSLFGIGTLTGRADARLMGKVILSWVLTLPVAALLACAAYLTLPWLT
ncbi:MAG: inorganic phosphate transporter [Elusimicrobia bacterium]|nr:inorganic phosphate transporter [Elusimicrobiota bacterium]